MPLGMDPTKVSKTDYAQFVADRLRMLELRNRRHALNVQLMEAGVGILETLTPEQWEFIQSQRDSIQATHETKEMEKLREMVSIICVILPVTHPKYALLR